MCGIAPTFFGEKSAQKDKLLVLWDYYVLSFRFSIFDTHYTRHKVRNYVSQKEFSCVRITSHFSVIFVVTVLVAVFLPPGSMPPVGSAFSPSPYGAFHEQHFDEACRFRHPLRGGANF